MAGSIFSMDVPSREREKGEGRRETGEGGHRCEAVGHQPLSLADNMKNNVINNNRCFDVRFNIIIKTHEVPAHPLFPRPSLSHWGHGARRRDPVTCNRRQCSTSPPPPSLQPRSQTSGALASLRRRSPPRPFPLLRPLLLRARPFFLVGCCVSEALRYSIGCIRIDEFVLYFLSPLVSPPPINDGIALPPRLSRSSRIPSIVPSVAAACFWLVVALFLRSAAGA